MAKDKTSFLLYCDIIHTIERLTDAQAGELFKHILRYVNDKDPISENTILNIAFEPIKQNLKRDLKKYSNICEKNRENINKRWNKKDTTVYDRIRSDTKHTDSDNDIDNDNVKEKGKSKVKKKVNPSFKEIDDYGKEKGYNLPVQTIIDHYTNGGELDYWIDANNKKVIRWKSKISSVWLKPEHLIKKNNPTITIDA